MSKHASACQLWRAGCVPAAGQRTDVSVTSSLNVAACENVKVTRLALVCRLTHAAVAGVADSWLF